MSAEPLGTELRPLLIAAALLKRWRFTVVFPVATALVTAVLVMVLPSRYTSDTSFTAQGQNEMRLPTGIANLAGELGLGLGGAGPTSAKFYAELVQTRAVLEAVLQHRLAPTRESPAGVRVIDWLDKGGKDRADSIDEALRYLRKRIGSDFDRETGVVSLSVSVRDPAVAAEIARAVLAEVDRFNTERRRSQARQRRAFIDQRIVASEADVRGAEDALERFYESNRLYRESPALVIEDQRLQARVTLLREVSLTLHRESETARIEEVNDTPVLTIVDEPSVPIRRSFPKRKLDVAAAFVAAELLGIALALLSEFLTAPGTADVEGREAFRAGLAEFKAGLGGMLRRRRGR